MRKIKVGLNVNIDNCIWGQNNYISDNCRIKNVSLGDFTYLNEKVELFNVKIGKFCSIGPNVKIGFGAHPTHFVSTHPVFYSKNKPFETFADMEYFNEYTQIEIGNDVWIGSDVKIIGNIVIGDGAIVAAGAIVTKNVEPYSIVGGIPAKVIKLRFEPSTINKIQNSQWWDKDINWLKTNYKYFFSVDDFIDKIKSIN